MSMRAHALFGAHLREQQTNKRNTTQVVNTNSARSHSCVQNGKKRQHQTNTDKDLNFLLNSYVWILYTASRHTNYKNVFSRR